MGEDNIKDGSSYVLDTETSQLDMPGLNVQVALSEALEVRGGPLRESEIWPVLTQTSEALQDLFLKGL